MIPLRFKNRFAILIAAGLAVFHSPAIASTIGADDASQPTYKVDNAPQWIGGMNGGTGFGGWNLVSSDTTGACGFFIGDSKGLAGGSGADINVNGLSFGMFGKGQGHSAAAYRSFQSPLATGATFTVVIAVNFRNGQKGFDLRDVATEKAIFNLNIGADDYVVNGAATGNGSIGSDYSNSTSLLLSFTQTSASGGTWTVTRSGGVSKTATGSYSGDPASIKLYVNDTDNGSENDLMLNSLTITAKQ
jgi:hypothetical protein